MKKLYRVAGEVHISHYMREEDKEKESFDLLVEAENIGLAKILAIQKYEKKTSEYDVYYSVYIRSAEEAVLSGEVDKEFLEAYSYLLE